MIKVEFNITIARKHVIKIHEKLKHKNAVFNYHYNGITAASAPRTAILSNTFLLIAPSFKNSIPFRCNRNRYCETLRCTKIK